LQAIRGKVVSGMGSFSFWIEKLRDHYQRKTGMLLFPGTLNLELEQPWRVPSGSLRLNAAEYGGTVTVNLVPCSIFGRPAFILRTAANEEGRGHHPRTIIEIATDVKLRDTYQLQDGDWVEVEISDEPVVSLTQHIGCVAMIEPRTSPHEEFTTSSSPEFSWRLGCAFVANRRGC